MAGIDLLKDIGLKTFKIASGEVNNYLMIDKLINLKKEIILSSGLSSYSELDLVIKKINKSKIQLSILQCTSEYPTSPKNIGLNIIDEMKKWLSGISIKSAEEIGLNGDAIEAEAFAFLGIRSLLEMPISFQRTSGITERASSSGGIIFRK